MPDARSLPFRITSQTIHTYLEEGIGVNVRNDVDVFRRHANPFQDLKQGLMVDFIKGFFPIKEEEICLVLVSLREVEDSSNQMYCVRSGFTWPKTILRRCMC